MPGFATLHVERPAHYGRGALHGTRPRKDSGFPAPAEPCALRPVHLKSGAPRFIGVGGRFAARAGFVHSHRRLCPRGNMAVAYFMVHAPRGFFPLLNGGELAIVYCFIFLYFWVAGSGEPGLSNSYCAQAS